MQEVQLASNTYYPSLCLCISPYVTFAGNKYWHAEHPAEGAGGCPGAAEDCQKHPSASACAPR